MFKNFLMFLIGFGIIVGALLLSHAYYNLLANTIVPHWGKLDVISGTVAGLIYLGATIIFGSLAIYACFHIGKYIWEGFAKGF